MTQNYRIQHLRKEFENFLRLAHTIEKMLELAGKNIFAQHLKALEGRQSLDRGLSSIEKHGHIGVSKIDTIYQNTLQREERERIAAEHERILEGVESFREELKCATSERTMAMILPGMDVVNRLRAHIVYERELLGRIALSSGVQQTVQRKGHRSKGPVRTNRRETRKQRFSVKTTHVPYALEPPPEL
ncbi:MAG: hypothetical protein WBE13_21185 [Candidatus Acidiferrum sp.]